MDAPIDLSGRWTGIYFYPHDPVWNANDNMPPTPFEAELTDADGAITGTTQEPDLLYPGSVDVRAVLEGRRDGGRLTFTKTPDARDRDHVILYDGEVSADGNVVAGRWTIPDEWSGEFRMQRRMVTETVAEEVSDSART